MLLRRSSPSANHFSAEVETDVVEHRWMQRRRKAGAPASIPPRSGARPRRACPPRGSGTSTDSLSVARKALMPNRHCATPSCSSLAIRRRSSSWVLRSRAESDRSSSSAVFSAVTSAAEPRIWVGRPSASLANTVAQRLIQRHSPFLCLKRKRFSKISPSLTRRVHLVQARQRGDVVGVHRARQELIAHLHDFLRRVAEDDFAAFVHVDVALLGEVVQEHHVGNRFGEALREIPRLLQCIRRALRVGEVADDAEDLVGRELNHPRLKRPHLAGYLQLVFDGLRLAGLGDPAKDRRDDRRRVGRQHFLEGFSQEHDREWCTARRRRHSRGTCRRDSGRTSGRAGPGGSPASWLRSPGGPGRTAAASPRGMRAA